jgi:hypothetical protein
VPTPTVFQSQLFHYLDSDAPTMESKQVPMSISRFVPKSDRTNFRHNFIHFFVACGQILFRGSCKSI